MSGDVSDRKRLVSIQGGNLRNNHIYISGNLDFFPNECFGASSKEKGLGHQITLEIEGLADPIRTDIATNAASGTPRCIFRDRTWAKPFFQKHGIREGDVIALERMGRYRYRVYPFETKNVRAGCVIPEHWPAPDLTRPTSVDLFAGCGGFSIGLHKAGFQTLLAVEWDKSACDTFAANISPRILNCAIQEVESFPACDVLVGGPPCQGFSNLGERVPNDPRRQLWRHYLRGVTESRPLIFVMENVPPLLKSAEFQEILQTARGLGYQVEWRILNAAFYGVPQQRKRAVIIGSRIGVPVFPKPTHRDPTRPQTFETEGLPRWRTVRDAISDLSTVPDENNWHIGRHPTLKSQRRYTCIPEGGNRWNLPPELTPECWKRKTQGGTDLFGRLWWDRPSVTIRTEFYKPEKGRYLHPSANRPITHREAARLQGFDDRFDFKGKRIEVGIQIGNAVPPPLGYEIAKAVYAEVTEYYKGINRTANRTGTYD